MIGSLCRHFGWPHDFWKTMGWRELRAWMAERNRQVRAESKRERTDPDSWDGYENDGWWQQQRRRRDQIRGHA